MNKTSDTPTTSAGGNGGNGNNGGNSGNGKFIVWTQKIQVVVGAITLMVSVCLGCLAFGAGWYKMPDKVEKLEGRIKIVEPYLIKVDDLTLEQKILKARIEQDHDLLTRIDEHTKSIDLRLGELNDLIREMRQNRPPPKQP